MAPSPPAATSITLKELQESRVGLVLMGGGAKGAYEVGVWKALWENGIRHFSVIAGTSVGALNALLISDKQPSEVERVWHEVVDAGLLQTATARRRVLRQLGAGYALFLAPFAAAGILWLGGDWLAGSSPLGYSLATSLLGLALLLYSNLALRAASNGFFVPLLKFKMADLRSVAVFAFLGGVVVGIAQAPDRERALRLFVILAIPVYIVVFWIVTIGIQIVRKTLMAEPLFTRPFFDETVHRVVSEAKYSHCSGPVWATLSRFSAYQNPFDIDWRYKRQSPFGESQNWRYNDYAQLVEWTPFYINFRNESDASWILDASSAIPYAFSTVTRGGQTFVDGGVVDNWPIAPVVQSQPDIIVVVCVNHQSPVVDNNNVMADNPLAGRGLLTAPTSSTLSELARKNWASFLFSSPNTEAEVDELRDQWVRASKSFQGPDNLYQLPAVPPEIGADPSGIRFLWICPSTKTAPNGPIANVVHGTMNFSREYVDELIRRGETDTSALLKNLKRA